MTDFNARSKQREWMDDLNCDDSMLRLALDELGIINRTLNGYSPSLRGIRDLLPGSCKEFSLLDVGAGGGDTLLEIARWAARRGIECRLRGIDIDPGIVAHAKEKTGRCDNVDISLENLFSMPDEESYDIVHAALVCHHFSEPELENALRKMRGLCRYGIVINDLHRHWFAYRAIMILTRVFAKSPMIQHDAPVSVLRGFNRRELDEKMSTAGFSRYRIRWFWAFRWQIVGWK